MLNLRLYNKEKKEMIMTESSFEQGKRNYYPYEFGIGYSSYDESKFILMYGSGLFDKNKKEIYEGDILKIDVNGHYKSFEMKVVCHFKDAAFWLKSNSSELLLGVFMEDKKQYNYIEIIGNIYEI